MRIPYRRRLFPRQALLPPSPNPTTPPLNVPEEGSTPVETPGGAAAPATGTSAATGDGGVAVGVPEGGESVVPNVTPTTRTTTIAPSATASGGSGGLLASAEQATKFTWWQLLCIALGGALLLGVILWAWWKVRRRTAMDKKRAKELEEEEEKGFKEAMEKRQAEQTGKLGKKGKGKGKDKKSGRKKRKDEESSDSDDSDFDESYDSVSDGGTIRPKRRKRAKRRHKRHRSGGRRNRRRDGYSDSDTGDSDASSITYYRPRRGRSHRERRYSDDSGYYSRDWISPPFTPTPPLPTLPKPTRRPTQPLRQPTAPPAKANFRDSVFSTYASMKKAAVRLKYVEAKVKLKKQLEDEDKLEKARQAKVKEANAEIEQDRRRRERAERERQSASSDRPLIPPVTSHSSGSSRGSMTPYLPTPPGRAATRTYSKDSFRTRQSSADSVRPLRTQRQPSSHDTFAIPPVKQAIRKDSGRSDTGLRSQIHNLLGNDSGHPPRQQTRLPTQSQPRQLVPTKPTPAVAKAPIANNAFQADWLSHPGPAFSVPQTARSGSVYLPVPKPKDRPMIAPGGLAPAPPPKAKSKLGQNTRGPTLPPAPASIAGGASAGGKWADRLRAKR